MYKLVIRPILFKYDAEKVHHFVVSVLKFAYRFPFGKQILSAMYKIEHPSLVREVAGLKFPNPVGLAAGFDKNAEFTDEMEALGFGFVEIGTVTPRPQPGNDKPRLFRLPADKGIINRMGFNNLGSGVASGKLQYRKSTIPIGGNIGKNKVTPNEKALDDYIACFNELYDNVDYFVVNVSSPNTPGLRELQEKGPLLQILGELQKLNLRKVTPKPIFLKIAPDLTNSQLDDIVDIVLESRIAGVIASNTTLSRSDLRTSNSTVEAIGAGGLSGKPLTKRSTEVVRYICQKSNHAFPVIAVGGIMSAQDALEKFEAGASLVQIYTGFIYEGPGLIKSICKSLIK